MKFIHLADVHLGIIPDKNQSWSISRSNEIYETFKNVIRCAKDMNIDLVLIAGDLFHGQPLLRDLREIDYLFKGIAPVKVVIIAGNHDYIQKNSFYLKFKWSDNVSFITDNEVQCISFPEYNTQVYGFSYHSREIKEARYDNVVPQDKNKINILLGHGGDSTHIPFDMNKIISNGFDYYAFGHIHKGYISKDSRFAYAGALEPTDKNDFGKKGYILGELGAADKKLKLEFIPCASREYILIRVNIGINTTNNEFNEYIIGEIEKSGKDNIYIIEAVGIRNENVDFNVDNIKSKYNIYEYNDNTVVEYNYEQLYKDNKNSLVGQVIKELKNKDDDALFYAVNSLLRTKR